MIYVKTNPVGIDKTIAKFQSAINSIGWDDMHVYGRLYINDKEDSKVAEAYVSDREYKEVFVDDRKNAVFGFLVQPKRSGFGMIDSEIKLIGTINLSSIFGDDERKDEEALLTVLDSIRNYLSSPEEGEISTRNEDVFSEVTWERVKFRDMQPWFNFSLTFNVGYKNDICI